MVSKSGDTQGNADARFKSRETAVNRIDTGKYGYPIDASYGYRVQDIGVKKHEAIRIKNTLQWTPKLAPYIPFFFKGMSVPNIVVSSSF